MPNPARVLIVDDSRLFRAAMEEALRGLADVEVVGSVYSGDKALEFLRTNAVDVVTLDVEMPGLNGLDTLRTILQMNATRPGREIGVIMVSAHTRAGADVSIEALQLGAFDVVAKPGGPSPEAVWRLSGKKC